MASLPRVRHAPLIPCHLVLEVMEEDFVTLSVHLHDERIWERRAEWSVLTVNQLSWIMKISLGRLGWILPQGKHPMRM